MEIKEKIKNLINDNQVCLFMKGTPDAPQCGFSMAVSNMLKILNVNFEGINVLEDQSLREGIKVFSDWCDCTAYYYDLLNRHPAYEGFRTARGMMLKFEERADAITLAKFLTEFSELGQTYTRRIENTIYQLNEKYLDEHGNIKN